MKDTKVYSDTRGGLPFTLLHRSIVTPVTPNVKSVMIILESASPILEFSTLLREYAKLTNREEDEYSSANKVPFCCIHKKTDC